MSKPSLNELLRNGHEVSSAVLEQLETDCKPQNCGRLTFCPGCSCAVTKETAEMMEKLAVREINLN